MSNSLTRPLLGKALAATLCCALGFAACSDDGGDELSKEGFIEQGDAVCLGFAEQVNDLPEPSTPEEAAEFLQKAAEIADAAYAELQALAPPEDGEPVHAALLSSLSESTAKVREAQGAAERNDPGALEAAMAEAVNIGKRADSEAKGYGFAVCGSEDELPDG